MSRGAQHQRPELNEDFWRDFLSHPDTFMVTGRRLFNRLPHGPRCRLCAAPFAGAGGSLMRMIGKRPSDGNPNVCNSCQKILIRHHGGAEVEGSMLFADVRGSTTMAERMSAAEFHAAHRHRSRRSIRSVGPGLTQGLSGSAPAAREATPS